MDTFGMLDLRQLAESNDGPCVTIYMPTHVAGADGQQDVVRLKNLAEQAERQLSATWLRAPEARDLIEPIRALSADYDFWEKRSHGLALFLDRATLRRFRVPMCLEELAVVNRRFHIKGVLPLLTSGDRCFILALSQNNVRLFEATEYQIEQVDVSGLPMHMDDALNLDGADRGSQSHFATRDGKGKESSVFHGQGGAKESHKDDLALFFRMIDESLMPVLRDATAPLVLAGVEYLLPVFRKSCHYQYLARPELKGNCDYLSAQQIHEKVWPLVKPLLTESREQAAAKYLRLAGTGKATDDLREALPAAFQGRIETLFVGSDCHIWGGCDPEGHVTDVHDDQLPGDEDLLDTAAVQTLLHGGSVHAVNRGDTPTPAALAAVMRF